MKANSVQQLEPISAIRVEKLGMQITISPVNITNPVRRAVWRREKVHVYSYIYEREMEREREREREREGERGGGGEG